MKVYIFNALFAVFYYLLLWLVRKILGKWQKQVFYVTHGDYHSYSHIHIVLYFYFFDMHVTM